MGIDFVPGPVTVRAPATSANLGPGFDTFGLALGHHDEVTARVMPGGCQVEISGEGAGELPVDDSHLVVRAMFATFDALGARPPGLVLSCVNRIPQARGMGSSSAAIVAGVQLARGLVVDGVERLDTAAALRVAAELEGHPDNVAPCLLGGFTIAWTEPDGARAVSLPVAPGVSVTVFVPTQRGLTEVARAALPTQVPHSDAAFTAGRAALLVHAITANPALLFAATEDRLHQDYRAAGMPGSAELIARLRVAGVAAVVSGAGPSVLALTEVPADFCPGMDWQTHSLLVDVAGSRIEGAIVGHAERDPVAAGRKS